MKKLSILFIIVILFTFILTGCTTDSREIDDQVYALAIGLDKGVDNKLRLTVQFPTYKGGGGGTGGMQKQSREGGTNIPGVLDGTVVETAEASTILEAIDFLNTTISRRISFVQVKELVLSEGLAKEGIEDYLDPFARFREIRRSMQVVICRGTAESFINENNTLVGESVAKSIELMMTESSWTGLFPRITFQSFYRDSLSPYGQSYAAYAGLNDLTHLKSSSSQAGMPLKTQNEILPGEEPRSGGLKREFGGTAVFDGGKMVGCLDLYETVYFLMVRGELQRGTIVIEDKNKPGDSIPLDVRLGRQPSIKAHFENGIPVIDVKLNIEVDLESIQSRVDYEKLSKINDINHQIEAYIQDGVNHTIEKTQKEWGADIFEFGKKVARNFLTVTDFENYHWLEHYREARINVEVNANVRRTGRLISSSQVMSSKGKVLTGGGK